MKTFEIVAHYAGRTCAASAGLDPTVASRNAFGHAVSRCRHATAVVDQGARVVLANDAFEHLAVDGLGIVEGALCCAYPRDQPGLDQLVHAATGMGVTEGSHSLVLVSRPSRRRPLVVRALSLPRADQESARADGLKRCYALVLVLELDAEPGSGADEALRLLGLTGSEARIAARVGLGMSPREVAAKLGLTEGTVRTRLKAVYAKLGMSRQSEVARLVTQVEMFASLD